MTEIYITRHGETEWNVEKRFQGRGNSELTERGRIQAESLSLVLERENIDLILSSPLKRALDTARIARGSRDIPLSTLDDLAELDLGEWEGCRFRDLEEGDPENFRKRRQDPFHFIPPGGESFPELVGRMDRAIREAARIAQGRRALVVTHGMSIMAILYNLTGKSDPGVFQRPVLRQASITKVRVLEEGRYEVVYVGDTGHYDLKDPDPVPSISEKEKK